MIKPFRALLLLSVLGPACAAAGNSVAAELVTLRPGAVVVAEPTLPPPVAAPILVAPILVPPVLAAEPVLIRIKPPRRYLTTYMARYPFGVLREDYTPLGAPGVSKAAYFGRPIRTATLHVSPRRAWRYDRIVRTRAVVRARY